MDVGDNYCPEERLLDASVMARHNMTPLGPARILERIPEGPARGMKRACYDNDDVMSVASGNNSVSAGSHYVNSVGSPAMFSPQALQHQQAQPTAALTSLQQRALQEQSMRQAMQQQQALQQQAMQQAMQLQQAMQQQQANAQQQQAQQQPAQQQPAQQNQQQIHAAVESLAQANNTTAPLVQHETDGVSTSLQEHAMQIMNDLDKEVEK